MIKNILKLANKLDKLGLTKEADILDKLLLKIATPLEGVVDFHHNEIVREYNPSQDYNKNLSEQNIERLPRTNRVLSDQYGRKKIKDSSDEEMGKWFDSIKVLGDSIILIPFDRSMLKNNPEVINGFGSIFGVSYIRNYKDLYDRVNIIDGINASKHGSLNILKKVFPSLWLDIQDILIKKDLKEEDVVYMFYNQETNPVRRNFTKNPFYFAHDLGHSDFDTEEANYFFKNELKSVIEKVSNLYLSIDKSKKYNEQKTLLNEIKNMDDVQVVAMNFFNTMGNPLDVFADIYANAVSGNLTIENIKIPETIILNEFYSIPSHNINDAKKIFEDYIKRIMLYLNPKVESGGFAPGPFKQFKGKVILQDV